MITSEQLLVMREGDQFEGVSLMPGVSPEKVVWQVREVFDNLGVSAVLKVHGYYLNTLVCRAKIEARPGTPPVWRFL